MRRRRFFVIRLPISRAKSFLSGPEPFPFRLNRNGLCLLFDAFSLREPGSTSLENALDPGWLSPENAIEGVDPRLLLREGKQDDQVPFRHSLGSAVGFDGFSRFGAAAGPGRLCPRRVAVLPRSDERRRPDRAGVPQAAPRPHQQAVSANAGEPRAIINHVLLPAAVATGNTSLAARSGVSSFQRTDPNGRSSMRRTRIGSGPRWKSIAR
jgi:hypothetical protein